MHRFDVAAHGARVAGQARGLGAGEMPGGGEWTGRAGLLRSACGLCSVPLPALRYSL